MAAIEAAPRSNLEVYEQPSSRQFELRLYDQRCVAGSAVLCDLCRSIASRQFPFSVTTDITAFQASSGNCTLCLGICDALIGLQSYLQSSWKSVSIRFNACSKIPRFYATEIIPQDGPYRSKTYQIYTELGQVNPEPIIGAARSISKESNSDRSFELIRNWISDCNRHLNCADASLVATLPTRVIDLRMGDEIVKLYKTQGEMDFYIALSHCWGPQGLPDSAKTTKQTMMDRIRGIQVKTLPKSFQDAISICRKLGIQFLWIDSLCIIQQDKEDWEKECSRMREVYRNSYLTISVALSSDSASGCFATRPSQHLSVKVGTIKHQGGYHDILSRESINHGPIGSSDGQSKEFPLWTRAWTFQERLLARRVVHYTERELLWECDTLSECECSSSQELLAGWHWQKTTKLFFSEMMNSPRVGAEFRHKWAVLMRVFSQMKLSFDADRLPCLSGLAKALECEETGKYVVGLWEKQLPWMIGWLNMSRNSCRPSSKPAPPTWSWTSAESAWISWNFSPDLSTENEWTRQWPNGHDLSVHDSTFEITQCSIRNVNCTPLGLDSTGRVSFGILALSGLIVPATLQEKYSCERNGLQQGFSPDVPSEPTVYRAGQTVYCLMIGAMNEESSKYPGLVGVSSLILRAHTTADSDNDSETCNYERIGIMRQNNHFAWKEAPLWWKGAEVAMVDII